MDRSSYLSALERLPLGADSLEGVRAGAGLADPASDAEALIPATFVQPAPASVVDQARGVDRAAPDLGALECRASFSLAATNQEWHLGAGGTGLRNT